MEHVPLHCLLYLRFRGARGQLKHCIECIELEKVAMLRRFILLRRTWPNVGSCSSPIRSSNTDGLTFCDVCGCWWDVEKYPVVKYTVWPERLWHIRIIHEKNE